MSVLDSSLQRWPILCLWTVFLTKEFHFLTYLFISEFFHEESRTLNSRAAYWETSQENWVRLSLSLSLCLGVLSLLPRLLSYSLPYLTLALHSNLMLYFS